MLCFAVSCDKPPVTVAPETLDAPAGLETGTLTATTAELSWTVVTEAEKYEVEINGMDAAEVNTAAYQATGLTPETEYTWRVRALKGGLESDWVSGPTFTTPEDGGGEPTPPPPPAGLEVTEISFSGALLSWQHADADSHEVVIDGGEAIPVTGLSYRATGLEPVTTYSWKVRSCRDDLWSEWEEGGDFTTGEVVVGPLTLFNDGAQYLGDVIFGEGTENVVLNFLDVDPYGGEVDATQIVLDIITTTMDNHPTIEFFNLPAGTYEINDTFGVNTIAVGDHTYMQSIVGGFPAGRWAIEGGTMTVAGDNTGYTMTFELLLEGGRILAEYNGTLPLENPYYLPRYGEVMDFGTMTHIFTANYYNNVFGDLTVDSWVLSAVTNANIMPGTEDGWLFNAQLLTHLNRGRPLPDGEYTVSDSMLPWTVLPGVFNEQEGTRDGLCIVRAEGGQLMRPVYPLTSGKLTTSSSGGVYTIVVDAFTSDGLNVKGTIQGTFP